MRRCLLFFSWLPLLAGQVQQQDPLDVAIQAYWKARGEGRYAEAVTYRETARRILNGLSPEASQFTYRAQTVAQFYDGAGKPAEARAILEKALAARPAGTRERAVLLSALSVNWEQERNWLKALAYQEQAIVAAAAPSSASGTPPPPDQPAAVMRMGCFGWAPFGANVDYSRLAELYRKVGKREEVAKLIERVRSQPDGATNAALLYEQNGQLDEAAAIYRAQAQADPKQALQALQSLARLQQNEQKYGDAVATLTRAVEAAAASEDPSQALWAKQNLAMALDQNGQTEAADQLYQQLLQVPDMRSQILALYANHLGATKRAAEAETLLQNELDTRADLQPWEQSNLYFTLANLARSRADQTRGEALEHTATELQQASQPPEFRAAQISADLRSAQVAVQNGNVEAALQLAGQILDTAAQAPDRDQVAWMLPQVADQAAARNPEAAAELYQRVLGLLESWSADTVQPLLAFYPAYIRSLVGRRKWDEASRILDTYRSTLLAAHGPDTGWLEEVMQLQIDLARGQEHLEAVVEIAGARLALAERLGGPTSEAYLQALENLASQLESNGDGARSLSMRRQVVTIADAVYVQSDIRRAWSRTNAAIPLANARQFDEADHLATEALAIATRYQPSQAPFYQSQLDQIHELRRAAASSH
jgi:Flp pilus assembly protein TadD